MLFINPAQEKFGGFLSRDVPVGLPVATGGLVGWRPDEALQTGNIDYVVRGEGEEVMLQLHRSLRGGADPTRLKGVSFTRDGRIVHNPEAPLIPDLDDIPT